MASCAFCKSQEAQSYEYGVPICPDCVDIGKSNRNTDIHSALVHALGEARLRVEAASREFKSLVENIPSGLPHPDGAQCIQNASRELTAARKSMGRAYDRLDVYLSQGIVPEDLPFSE